MLVFSSPYFYLRLQLENMFPHLLSFSLSFEGEGLSLTSHHMKNLKHMLKDIIDWYQTYFHQEGTLHISSAFACIFLSQVA